MCGIQQPDLVAIEKGRAVPSPLLAGKLVGQLSMSPTEISAYFRLLGEALLEHSPVSRSTTAPALCAFAEWLLLSQVQAATRVSAGVEIAAIPNTESFIGQMRAGWSDLEQQLTAEQRGAVAEMAPPIPNAYIEHSDGTATLVVPLKIHLDRDTVRDLSKRPPLRDF